MDSFQAFILGLVQGLTEFLPVSSSGHLVIAGTLLDVVTPGVFVEVALHVGTLLSVIIVYRKRLGKLATGAIRREPGAWRYLGLLLLASVPAGLVGILLKDQIEEAFGAPWITGITLILTGFILWTTRRPRPEPLRVADGGIAITAAPAAGPVAGPAAGSSAATPIAAQAAAARAQVIAPDRTADSITWKLALGIGLAQAVAILPGISRSGSTITAGIWGRLSGEAAAEFSFLMSIIVIAGAALLELRHFGSAIQGVGAGSLFVGFLTALVTGIIAIQSLVWLLRKQAFHVFAYYVWAVGALFLIYLAVSA
jgi:undecaprenyl-diphosphatase